MAAPQNPQADEIEAEEEEEDDNGGQESPSPTSSSPCTTTTTTNNNLSFWFYTAAAFVTLLAVLLSLPPSFSLPPDLHRHYSSGTFVKTHLSPNLPPTQLFTVDHKPTEAANPEPETVLLVHGLGCSSYSFRHVVNSLSAAGFRAVAVDLPGSGFSDLAEDVEERRRMKGVLGGVFRVYRDVKEKGLFWGFDQLVDKGYVPYEEEEEEEDVKECDLGRILGHLVESLGLANVHVVAHDSAIGAVASWASAAKPGFIRSITFVDSLPGSSAFPTRILEIPILREVVLRSRWAFGGLIRICCSRSIDESAVEAYRVMLRREGRRMALVDAGKSLKPNQGFDFGEWAGSGEVKDVPLQVLWSHMTSDAWIREGERIAASVPRAKFVPHLGGRWPQEGASEEVAGKIVEFVSSLRKTYTQVQQEALLEEPIKMCNEAKDHH